MKKLFVTLIVIGLLAGCTSKTGLAQIQKSIELCEANNGLMYIKSIDNQDYKYARCNNGANFRITPSMLK